MTEPTAPRHLTTLHRLRRHRFLKFPHPHGLCLRAERGTLWVTVDGDPADIEMNAGEHRVFSGTATVIVGTLGGDALVSATAAPAPAGIGWLRERLRAGLSEWLGRPALGLRP